MAWDIIFMHNPKVAGCSILHILHEHGVSQVNHNIRDPRYVSLEMYLEQCRNIETFCCTFVRNPWDRLVSAFFYLQQGGNNANDEKDRERLLAEYNGDFRRFVLEGLRRSEVTEQMHFRPQYLWFSDSQGNLLADFVGRYEQLEADLQQLLQMIGVNDPTSLPQLPRHNASKHRPFASYYDAEMSQVVEEVYAQDIELFGYSHPETVK